MDTARSSDTWPLVEGEGANGRDGLAQLANHGTVYTAATANAPWTVPSHGTLFSGVHPSIHGAHAGHKSFEHDPTLAGLLREAGYRTLAVSNNTWISDEFGYGRGFEEFVATWQLFQDGVDFGQVARTETGVLDKLRGVARNFSGNPIKNLANLVYGQFFRKREDDGAARTNEILADRIPALAAREDPFFLFVNYLEPHLQYRPPADLAREYLPEGITFEQAMDINQDAWAYITGDTEMSDRDFEILHALYRAELDYLDGRIADLLDLFTDAGVREDTVFVIVGDHGENIGDHGLMDHQYSLHETLLNVPVIASGPGFDNGRTVDTPVQLLDVFPTLLDVAGVDLEVDDVPGTSLYEVDKISGDRPVFAEYVAPQPSISTLEDRYDCRTDISGFNRRLWSVKRDGLKLIRGSDGSSWCFDLKADPDERSDISEEYPDIRDRLSEVLDEWVETLPEVRDEEVAMDDDTRDRLEDLGYLT